MDKGTMYLLAIVELVAMVVVWQLWTSSRPVAAKIVWSVILLVPLFGLAAYGFLAQHPGQNPSRTETGSDRDAFSGGSHGDGGR